MRHWLTLLLFSTFFLGCLTLGNEAQAEAVGNIGPKDRCPVCGMFVVKYQGWVCQIHYKNGVHHYFDGVKDSMAFLFHPEEFGGGSQKNITELWAQDYYTLQWVDMKKAFYVVGSDVYGPMGHELVPFASEKAAQSFKKDHHGKKIYSFEQITPEIVESLRAGHMMK